MVVSDPARCGPAPFILILRQMLSIRRVTRFYRDYGKSLKTLNVLRENFTLHYSLFLRGTWQLIHYRLKQPQLTFGNPVPKNFAPYHESVRVTLKRASSTAHFFRPLIFFTTLTIKSKLIQTTIFIEDTIQLI